MLAGAPSIPAVQQAVSRRGTTGCCPCKCANSRPFCRSMTRIFGPVSNTALFVHGLFNIPSQPRIIVISSPGLGDGKSLSAINIAGALSLKTSAKVLLVDADFRRASIHTKIGFPESPGLAEMLGRGCSLEAAVIRCEQFPSLYVLPAGERPANPVELLDSPQWGHLCARLRKEFEYIIIDSPPMEAVADYDLIQAAVRQCGGGRASRPYES